MQQMVGIDPYHIGDIGAVAKMVTAAKTDYTLLAYIEARMITGRRFTKAYEAEVDKESLDRLHKDGWVCFFRELCLVTEDGAELLKTGVDRFTAYRVLHGLCSSVWLDTLDFRRES